jgi:hypothetical protein
MRMILNCKYYNLKILCEYPSIDASLKDIIENVFQGNAKVQFHPELECL